MSLAAWLWIIGVIALLFVILGAVCWVAGAFSEEFWKPSKNPDDLHHTMRSDWRNRL
jgi:hypothetical protein